jgi:predicted GNAT family N-acyltransferase
VLVVNEHNQEVATGRITPKGEIGRIAVEPEFRCPEVYQSLFKALLEITKKHGFRSVGRLFMDAGVARQNMLCDLKDFILERVELTH